MKLRGCKPCLLVASPVLGYRKNLVESMEKCEEDLADGYGTVGKANEVLSGD